MQWSDVVKAPSTRMLRQFAGLWLVVFGGIAAWRAWQGQTGPATLALFAVAVIVGAAGLMAPAAVRPIFSAWMVLAFPIGWTVSRIALGLMFFVLFTSVGYVFRMTGRDTLRLRRSRDATTYWLPKPPARSGDEYLRQY